MDFLWTFAFFENIAQYSSELHLMFFFVYCVTYPKYEYVKYSDT